MKDRPRYYDNADLGGRVSQSLRSGELRRLEIDGLSRSYLLSIPPGMDRDVPAGVILAFHGGGGSPTAFMQITSMDRVATDKGLVLVYPEGYQNSWNIEDKENKWGAATKENIDDISFVQAILGELEESFQVDHSRIYAAGFSNGGSFAYRLACEMPDTFAAIAVVAGSLAGHDKMPNRAVPLLHMHGVLDKMSPISGGEGSGQAQGTRHRGIPKTIVNWVNNNHLDPAPTSIHCDENATIMVFSSDQVSADVYLYIVSDMGHQWPGGKAIDSMGPGKTALNCSEVIVDFFVSHPMAKTFLRIPSIGL